MSPRSYAQHNHHQYASDCLRPVAGWDIYNAYAIHQNSPVKRIDQTLHTRCDLVTARLHGDTVLEVINPWGFQDLLRLTQHVQAREDKVWRQTLILRDEARVELTALISDASPGTLRFELERDCVLKLSSDYLAASLAHPMHMKVDSAGSAMLIFETAGIDLNIKATPLLHGLSGTGCRVTVDPAVSAMLFPFVCVLVGRLFIAPRWTLRQFMIINCPLK